MIDFIDGPCRWDPFAPAELRRHAPGGVSVWRNYATSRFLDDLEPIVLHAVGIPDAPCDSVVQVELLPEAVARRWQQVGLEFATEAEIGGMGFPEVLVRSLDLIRTVLPLRGTIAGVCRSLHVLMAPDRDFDVSYSDPSVPFSVFVSCPPPSERNRLERLAENIVHEALHLQLTLVERVESLVIDVPGETPVFSPWKNERRNVRGLMHAVYVFGNLRCFWRCVAVDVPELASFARTRIETIDREMDGARQLATNCSLTAMGQRLARSCLDS